jgi:hypothetical protein
VQSSTILLDKNFDDFEAEGMAHHEDYYLMLATILCTNLDLPLARLEIIGHVRGSVGFVVVAKPGSEGACTVADVKKKMAASLNEEVSPLRQALPAPFKGHERHNPAETQAFITKRLQTFIENIRPPSVAALHDLLNALLQSKDTSSTQLGRFVLKSANTVTLAEFSTRLKSYVAAHYGIHELQDSAIESLFRVAYVGAANIATLTPQQKIKLDHAKMTLKHSRAGGGSAEEIADDLAALTSLCCDLGIPAPPTELTPRQKSQLKLAEDLIKSHCKDIEVAGLPLHEIEAKQREIDDEVAKLTQLRRDFSVVSLPIGRPALSIAELTCGLVTMFNGEDDIHAQMIFDACVDSAERSGGSSSGSVLLGLLNREKNPG